MTPQTRRVLKISAVVLGGLLGIAVVVLGAVYVNFYNATRDPIGARDCKCELLKQWATTLPLTPQDQHVQARDVRVTEDNTGFQLTSGLENVIVDRQSFLDTLTSHGLNHRTDIDQPDFWNTVFYPGSDINGAPWSFDVGAEESGIGIRIDVDVDGSPWGLETNEDVHEFYVEDHQAALAAQVERQKEAIRILRPLQQALEAMVQGS